MAVKFDLAGKIPTGATITSANLELNQTWNNNAGDISCDVRKISRAWTPSNVTWSNFAPENSTSGSIVQKTFKGSVNNWDRFDITSAVKAWFATPSSNFGAMIHKWSGDDISWASEKNTTTTRRPRLIIAYSTTAVLAREAVARSGIQISKVRQGLQFRNDLNRSVGYTVCTMNGKVIGRYSIAAGSTRAVALHAGTYLIRSEGASGVDAATYHISK